MESKVIDCTGCSTSVKAEHTLSIITVQLWYNVVIVHSLVPHDPIEDAEAERDSEGSHRAHVSEAHDTGAQRTALRLESVKFPLLKQFLQHLFCCFYFCLLF